MIDTAFDQVYSPTFSMRNYQTELSILLTISDRMCKSDPHRANADTFQTLLSFLDKVSTQMELSFRGSNGLTSGMLCSNELLVGFNSDSRAVPQ